MPKVAIACRECGEEFERFPSQAGAFCSRTCMYANAKQNGWLRRKRIGENRQCARCDQEFWVPPSQHTTAVYCSVDCKNRADGRLRAECEVCKQEFYYYPSNRSGRFCSKGCEQATRYRRPTGRMHNGKPVVINKQGYPMLHQPGHPRARLGGWITEHTLVMESLVGRLLEDGENVHHKNGVREDNRPENLELWVRPQPSGARATDLVAWARQIIEKYDPP